MEKKAVQTDKAPAAIGPYSQAIRVGNLLFTSGQVPIDPTNGEITGWEIKEQARQVFINIQNLLAAQGCTLANVVKTTVFLRHMSDFPEMNEIYAEFFSGTIYPARSTVEVSRLPKDALIEIETITLIPE
ncbi:MAG: RidA family protein [Chloroflexi bacterium]|uniref:RidA family protein n=1 Tax=Candidatus Chlorohelix allophototropha TaxID=3003348 RepID=A0A8T7M7I0_9CHLR|nr:RidA family protein [Chloroflexota bacterium]WJW68029.1 RidA family protein [Chloroflexota bacterium L227-S17]